MDNDFESRQLRKLRQAHEQECQRRAVVEQQLHEALTLLQRTMEDREKYRDLVEDINAVVYATDHDHRIAYVSPLLHLFTGFQPEDCIGRPFLDFIHRDDRRRVLKAYEQVAAGDLRATEYRIRRKQHGYCWVRSFSRPIIENGAFQGLRGVLVDISDRKNAQEAFKQTEQKYQTIIESVEEGYFEVDLQGNLTFVSTPLCRIAGISRAQLMFSNFRRYVPRDVARTLMRIFNRVQRTGIPLRDQAFEAMRQGERLMLEISASLVRDHEGQPVGFRGMLRNISERYRAEAERKELERQLQQAQRMEAIGTLAGGIAHDFNNILMGMQGNLSLLLMRMPSHNPLVQKLKNIEQYILNGAGLTRQLLDFARSKPRPTQLTDLNFLIRKTARMLGRTWKEVEIDLAGLNAAWAVIVDSGQIEQVLINLYVNACQAMPGGGKLFLRTEDVELGRSTVRPFGLKAGPYVMASVIDTGIGMDEITQQKIFNPFFTTKERSRGTGLGLSSAYGIIKNHQGFIKVSSKEGHGANFSIYLPASKAAAQTLTERPLAPVSGSGTILVVDDEQFITEITREWLGELGYTVLEASSGSRAVECFRANPGAIDLVILDVIMPGMDGGETLARLKAIDPQVKVLLTSGYGYNARAEKICRNGCKGFIAKPYDINQLSQKIRDILDVGAAHALRRNSASE
jgi:two-component system cell cycle sensor histidine kinase/response regulator CckA